MQSPTIEMLLVNAGDKPLSQLPLAVQALSLVSLMPIDPSATAAEHLENLRLNEPHVLSYTVQQVLQQNNPNIKQHRISTIIMMVVMSIMAVGYAGIQMYIAVTTKQLLQWNEMMVPILGPLMIVWYERGILRKENRDMLQAILGRTPMSVAEAATDYFTTRTKRYDNSSQTTDTPAIEDNNNKGRRESY